MLLEAKSQNVSQNVRSSADFTVQVYSYSQLQHIVSKPAEAVPGGGSGSLGGGHNVYGTPALMERLRQDPKALKPAASAL